MEGVQREVMYNMSELLLLFIVICIAVGILYFTLY